MPIRPEPICVASRMRCDSPPDSVPRRAVELQIVEADVDEKAEPGLDLFQNEPGDPHLFVIELQCSKNCCASRMDRSVT